MVEALNKGALNHNEFESQGNKPAQNLCHIFRVWKQII